MTTVETYIISIPVSERGGSDVGLATILEAIGRDRIAQLTWGVSGVEALGTEALQVFLDALDAAPAQRLLVPGTQLLDLANTITQLIEGAFVGYAAAEDAKEFLDRGWESAPFETSAAEVMVQAVDGCLLDVFLRSHATAERLLAVFQDARRENLSNYRF